MLAVLPVFWLLQKILHKFRREFLKVGFPVSVFIPPGKVSFRGPAYKSHDLMILHVHKQQVVDRLDLDKICENCVSGREGTSKKIGLFLWAVWEFCWLVTLLKLTERHLNIFMSFQSSAEELEQQLCSVQWRSKAGEGGRGSGSLAAPSGGGTLLTKIKFWKEFKISNSFLLLLNKVLNGLPLFSYCVWKS